jgi:hypothetical protein
VSERKRGTEKESVDRVPERPSAAAPKSSDNVFTVINAARELGFKIGCV